MPRNFYIITDKKFYRKFFIEKKTLLKYLYKYFSYNSMYRQQINITFDFWNESFLVLF